MSKTFLVNIADREDITRDDGTGHWHAPGHGKVSMKRLKSIQGTSRYLGRSADDVEGAPWAYYNEFKAGSVIGLHQHDAGRVEFVIEGKIEWHEPGQPARIYGPGTLSHVEANTPYGYTVLEDAKILIVFDAPPRMGSM